jgi:hypothetical protein
MSSPSRQMYSIEEIKDLLIGRMRDVAWHYAPPAKGSYEDKGQYFTLNPGRADRSVGSFVIHLSGPRAGTWKDFATGDHGDPFDLIGLALGLRDMKDQLREARSFLGLAIDSPAERAQREVAIAASRARQAAAEADLKRQAERKSRQAEAMWLAAEPKIAGTPVDHYLKGRGIDLATIGHQPRALRYLAKCRYSFTDKTTGEVIEFDGPAMVAAMTNLQGRTVAIHRTWLAIDPATGRWGKVRIPHPSAEGEFLPAKKVYGWGDGCAIRLSSGLGPKGGKGAPLNRCPPGTRVHIAEGIETALSARILRPEARVLAAYSLSNMAQVGLPKEVAEVVLITDHDFAPQAQEQLDEAIRQHQARGRVVRLWRSERPGEDLNDALIRAQAEEQAMKEGAA